MKIRIRIFWGVILFFHNLNSQPAPIILAGKIIAINDKWEYTNDAIGKSHDKFYNFSYCSFKVSNTLQGKLENIDCGDSIVKVYFNGKFNNKSIIGDSIILYLQDSLYERQNIYILKSHGTSIDSVDFSDQKIYKCSTPVYYALNDTSSFMVNKKSKEFVYKNIKGIGSSRFEVPVFDRRQNKTLIIRFNAFKEGDKVVVYSKDKRKKKYFYRSPEYLVGLNILKIEILDSNEFPIYIEIISSNSKSIWEYSLFAGKFQAVK